MSKKPDFASNRLRQLAGKRRTLEGFALESAETGTVQPEETLHNVHSVLQAAAAEAGDPSEFERALNIFMRHAESGLHQLQRDPNAPLDRNSTFALEAVIRTDGTRPSLLVKQGTVDTNHPLAATWKETLDRVLPDLLPRIAAVGRLETTTPSASNFFGTGWLVAADADRKGGIILTNLHVLEKMRARLANAVLPNGKGGFQFLGDNAFIDFVAESGSINKNRFKIVEGTPSGVDGPGYAQLDAAVLRIAGGPNPASAVLPEPIPVIPDLDGPRGVQSFCIVGYPGPPPYSSGVRDGVDWNWVNATLFGGRYGVKRLAPGEAHRHLGDIDGDARPWVFGHDATTLGGSSGSPVLAWLDGVRGGFGLHFAGTNMDSNYAHALAQARAELEKLGVPFSRI